MSFDFCIPFLTFFSICEKKRFETTTSAVPWNSLSKINPGWQNIKIVNLRIDSPRVSWRSEEPNRAKVEDRLDVESVPRGHHLKLSC